MTEQSNGGDGLDATHDEEKNDHGTEPHDMQPMPLDLESPQFTARAVLTGMVLAAVLSMCNIYAGLKIGWGFNMSITAALLGYGFWMGLHGLFKVRKFGILENNINQTACSSGASVSSAGLVAPIPALAMITGQTLTWHWLALWVFSVCLVGITAAMVLRHQMLVEEKLPFPSGIASAETLKEMYARGAEAMARVKMLVSSAIVAGGLKLIEFKVEFGKFALPGGLKGFSLRSLTFSLDTTFLMYAVGGLVGLRASLSMLIGALLAWGLLTPGLLHDGKIRLTTYEPLPYLSEGVAFKQPPEGHAHYDERRHQLIYKGAMGTAERDELLGLSREPLYQEAVRKAYVRSQMTLSASMTREEAALLPDNVPIRWDEDQSVAIATAGLDRPTYQRLKALEGPLSFQAAIDTLYSYFQYSTTRALQTSVPLEKMPDGFSIPVKYSGLVFFDWHRGALVALAPADKDVTRAVIARLDQFLANEPGQEEAGEKLRSALKALSAKVASIALPAGVNIPSELVEVVKYDPQRQTLAAKGLLAADELEALSSLSADPDFTAVVSSLGAGASYIGPPSPNFRDVVGWLLWPGVTLMVVASLTSLLFSWRSFLSAFTGKSSSRSSAALPANAEAGEVPRKWFLGALVVALLLSVVLQVAFFEIVFWAAIIGVLLTFILAVVAARVSGETNITPIGAMGKVTQLFFGIVTPGQATPNLMAANVTGGAASQCADLLHDLKTGHLIGASPKWQSLAQLFGTLAGALAGSAAYLVLIPRPQEQLITAEWAAPAVATWKAVAELFMVGFNAIPEGTPTAMILAAIAAIVLAVLEKKVSPRFRKWVPSPSSLGLAFVIQAYTSMAMFIGALIAYLLARYVKSWTDRFLIAACAGVIAGETLVGVGIGLSKIDWMAFLR